MVVIILAKYVYNINPTVTDCKYWGYVLTNDGYAVKLNKGDSIIIKQTTTVAANSPIINGYIDTLTHRFYHICDPLSSFPLSTGYFQCTVDGSSCPPIYGCIPLNYVAYPRCPNFGTITVFLWDTSDVAKTGLTTYEYIYQGDTPLTFKTIEYYVTVYHGG